jgi:hypothetical protein
MQLTTLKQESAIKFHCGCLVFCISPREMLLEKGAGSLSDTALLAILLRTGRPRPKCHCSRQGDDKQVWRASWVDDGNSGGFARN